MFSKRYKIDSHLRHPRHSTYSRSKTKPFIIVLSLVMGLTLVVGGVGVIGGAYILNLIGMFETNTTKIEEAFPAETNRPAPNTTDAVNILLMGSDSRGAITTVGDSQGTDQRTDSMMLVHIDADRKNVYVMSVMRDLWIPIPDHGTAKINAAYAFGGSPLVINTLENLLGARINHVAVVDFEGFKGITDTLGGVDVTLNQPFNGGSFSFVRGVNHLTGDKALAFVRERHAFADADFQRVNNQQMFLSAIMNKIFSGSILQDPGKIASFVGALSSYLAVDKKMDVSTIVSLGVSLRGVTPSNIHYFTIPTGGIGMVGDQSVVFTDEEALTRLRKSFITDTLSTFVSSIPFESNVTANTNSDNS